LGKKGTMDELRPDSMQTDGFASVHEEAEEQAAEAAVVAMSTDEPQQHVDFLVRPAVRATASAGAWLCSLDELRGHILAALNSPADLANFEVRAGSGPSAAVRVQVQLDGVSMHALHSHVLSGDFDLALERQLEELPGSVVDGTTLVADRTAFVESFEAHAAASSLTDHQQQKLSECDGHADVHLAAVRPRQAFALPARHAIVYSVAYPTGRGVYARAHPPPCKIPSVIYRWRVLQGRAACTHSRPGRAKQ
jgi:hypothetical protein